MSRVIAGVVALYPEPPYDGTPEDWRSWAGRLPNTSGIGLEVLEAAEGRATLRLARSPWTLNPNGGVNGGLLIAAADQCMGIVAATRMEAGSLPATATFHAEFHRPAPPPVTLHARVTRRGRNLMFVTVEIEDDAGTLCVHCTGSMSVRRSAPTG